jgi:hypothetical protein
VDVTGNITAKLSEVWSEFNIFCTLDTMATAAILSFFQPPKSFHTLRWIFLQSFMKFDERNNGCRCHGNSQNAKKLKNTKMIIAGYSPNRNL